jgi:hypothetical protein
MAEYSNTLGGLLQLNDQNLADIFVTNVLDGAPTLDRLFAQEASQGGTTHKYMRETVLPGAAFRKLNTGLKNAAGQDEQVTVECELLDASFTRDVGLALGYAKGVNAYMERETAKSLRAAFRLAEEALFYPQATGFIGLGQFPEYYVDDGDNQQIINKGGANGASTSVWLLRTDENGVSIIAGNDGNIQMSTWDDEPPIIQVYDPVHDGYYSAFLATILGYFGLQVGAARDVVRIAGLDGTAGKSLTDDIIGEAIERFPEERQPNLIVMNSKAREQLRSSRTAVNAMGAPAPMPEESLGIEILVTSALVNTEASLGSSTTTTTSTATAG